MDDRLHDKAPGPGPAGEAVTGAAAGPRSGGDGRGQQPAALRQRLLDQAGAIATAADWAGCLHTVARLPGNSFANILLIHAQRPDATQVRDYQAWQSAGRQVSRGEHGIQVFAATRPAPGAGRPARRARQAQPPVPGWREATRVTRVWDISQTSGPALPAPAALPAGPGELPAGLRDALCWLARRAGFAVQTWPGAPADGVTFAAARRIRIPPGPGTGPVAWALAHQLGHVLMHNAAADPAGAAAAGGPCAGIVKADADAVAFIICACYGITAPHQPPPGSWAGTDPRAQPAAAVLAAGQRITAAASQIIAHLDRTLPGHSDRAPAPGHARAANPAQPQAPHRQAPAAASTRHAPHPAAGPAAPGEQAARILDDAAAFYAAKLAGSWAPAYLASRGISQHTAAGWQIGYAPAGWTTLTDHLRAAGYTDEEIEDAGLARRSSRRTLIDHFRDRVMLPVHDEHDRIAGFTGRARPGLGPAVPKYLNSPQTSLYRKSHLLFGLKHGRAALAAGAIPVIGEGPFDAIAITTAANGRHAGLAPCGTALTGQQAALLGQACDLARTGALVAFDPDPAGRNAAIRAYAILRPHTAKLQAAGLAGRDPAQILQEQGARALRDALTTRAEPLLGVIADAEISRLACQLGDAEGPYRAVRAAATALAGLLPSGAAAQIRQIAAGAELAALDDQMRPLVSPQLPAIARALPADTAREVTRLAGRLGFTSSDLLIEVANAATRQAARPARLTAARLAAGSFPGPPLQSPPPGQPASPPHPAQSSRPLQGRRSTSVTT